LNIKDNFSARVQAIQNFKNNKTLFVKKIKDIPSWSGKYQH
jgi:hypothetical protein